MKMPRLRAGELRHRIQIRRAAETDDGHGGFTTTWTTIGTVWAEVLGMDGRESVVARALQGISTYRIRIRWRSDQPQPADQLRYADQDLNIRSCVDPNGEREQLLILADTESAQAD